MSSPDVKDSSIFLVILMKDLILSEGLSKSSIPCHFLLVLIAPDPIPNKNLPFDNSSISNADLKVESGLLVKASVTAEPIFIFFVILAIYAKNMIWVYSIFICIGCGQGYFMPSAMNLVYDFAGERDKKTYMALIDSFLAPFALLFLLIIGYLINQNSYKLSFVILGLCLSISIIIIQFFVRDPKNKYEQILPNS